MNLEAPFWKSRLAFGLASVALALSIFFSSYDFAWRPHQSLPTALFFAALAPLFLLLVTAADWGLGRLFRIPVEWDFLLRLQVWLTLLSVPLFFVSEIWERHPLLQPHGRSLILFASGILISLWVWQIVRRYHARVSRPTLWAFCAFMSLITAVSTIKNQSGPKTQVMGAQHWKWEKHGRIHLAYTEAMRDAATATQDARRVAALLGRVEKTLGAPSSSQTLNVFLFPDASALQEIADSEWMIGAAGEAGILVTDGEWEWIRGTVVHELSHWVVAREFGPDTRPLTDEGTAVWLENKLAPSDETITPERDSSLKTATLALNETFYNEDYERNAANYGHAGWLAQTTIQKHGLEKWRQFLDTAKSNVWQNLTENPENAGREVAAQYQQIFGEKMP